MSDEQFRQHIQIIYQQMAVLHSYMMQLSPLQLQNVAEVLEEMAAAFDNLQVIYEDMQTRLEAAVIVQEELLQKNQPAIAERQYYYDLFQFCPDAYLVIDVNGLILEANWAIAKLLKIPQSYLPGKPFAVFIAEGDRQAFRTLVNQLSSVSDVLNWEMSLCPRHGEPFAALLKVALARDDSGSIAALRIGVHDMSEYRQIAQPAQLRDRQDTQAETISLAPSLPQAFDGLQVLVVDDEADAREFITAVLESHGIRVTTVATAAAALEALERFHPDVLISDIRMPDENGYSLIR
jgi:PAS domain S-box-containing protein